MELLWIIGTILLARLETGAETQPVLEKLSASLSAMERCRWLFKLVSCVSGWQTDDRLLHLYGLMPYQSRGQPDPNTEESM